MLGTLCLMLVTWTYEAGAHGEAGRRIQVSAMAVNLDRQIRLGSTRDTFAKFFSFFRTHCSKWRTLSGFQNAFVCSALTSATLVDRGTLAAGYAALSRHTGRLAHCTPSSAKPSPAIYVLHEQKHKYTRFNKCKCKCYITVICARIHAVNGSKVTRS